MILRNATGERFGNADARKGVVAACEGFVRMYRPHEAREDTLLFPALRKFLPAGDDPDPPGL